jgi:hypothetical protein
MHISGISPFSRTRFFRTLILIPFQSISHSGPTHQPMANRYTSTSVKMHGAWQSSAKVQAWQATAAAQDCGILNGLESRSASIEMLGAWQANAATQAGESADPTRQLIMQQQQTSASSANSQPAA